MKLPQDAVTCMYRKIALILLITIPILSTAVGCIRPKAPVAGPASTVLSEGVTPPNPEYFVTDTGEVVYTGDPTGEAGGHDPNFPAVFEGADRIYPANDDPKLRESYLTRAPLDVVSAFYNNYLDIRRDPVYMQTATLADDFAVVQSVEMRDSDGRRQAALFVNKDEGPRGGMKVMIKEFPAQHAVQIILTTLDATPPGLNPFGYYASPEDVEKWTTEEAARAAERERQRQEAERQAQEQGQRSAGN
jgi:hypothetical protein